MKYTNILTESIFMSIDQAWQNVQFMGIGERKLMIERVIALSSTKSSFIDYHAKYYLAHLIHASEPYFNVTGKQTRVKEFDALGWYDNEGKLDFNKVVA